MKQVKRLGPITDLLGMIPGMGKLTKDVDPRDAEEPPQDRSDHQQHDDRRAARPDILNASRRRRIAAGSGTTVQDVNLLMQQFRDMQKIMKQMGVMGGGRKKNKHKGKGRARPRHFPAASPGLHGHVPRHGQQLGE